MEPHHRRRQGGIQGGHAPPIFRTYSHFVLREAFFQTRWCYSPKIKNFVPPKFFPPYIFGLAAPLYYMQIKQKFGQIFENRQKRPNKIFAAKPLLKTVKFS